MKLKIKLIQTIYQNKMDFKLYYVLEAQILYLFN